MQIRKRGRVLTKTSLFISLLVLCVSVPLWLSFAQQPSPSPTPLPPTLGLDQGYLEFETPDFKVKLVKASQTIAALQPKGADGFDFTPADRLERRAANGYHHLGDLTLRLRTGNTGPWHKYDTAEARKAVQALPASGQTLAIADLAATLPADIPLQIIRSWSIEDGRLVLRFNIKNKTGEPVQIGALGIPVIFNDIITGRNLKEMHERCSFFDPYIGQDAGYLQVTRLSGLGPALVVAPQGQRRSRLISFSMSRPGPIKHSKARLPGWSILRLTLKTNGRMPSSGTSRPA